MRDNLEKLARANEKADKAVDPWMQRVVDSPYTAPILIGTAVALVVIGIWLGVR